MPTTRPAFFVSAAEARFLSQKLPEGREGGREGAGRPSRTAAGTDHLELGAGSGGKGRAKRRGREARLNCGPLPRPEGDAADGQRA